MKHEGKLAEESPGKSSIKKKQKTHENRLSYLLPSIIISACDI